MKNLRTRSLALGLGGYLAAMLVYALSAWFYPLQAFPKAVLVAGTSIAVSTLLWRLTEPATA
jgi:hypothetical protein